MGGKWATGIPFGAKVAKKKREEKRIPDEKTHIQRIERYNTHLRGKKKFTGHTPNFLLCVLLCTR